MSSDPAPYPVRPITDEEVPDFNEQLNLGFHENPPQDMQDLWMRLLPRERTVAGGPAAAASPRICVIALSGMRYGCSHARTSAAPWGRSGVFPTRPASCEDHPRPVPGCVRGSNTGIAGEAAN